MFFSGSKSVDQLFTTPWLCQWNISMHLPLSPKKSFFESFFFSLRGIKWNTNICRLRIKARELRTSNDFIFAQKKKKVVFLHDTQLLLHNRKQDLQHPRFSFEMSLLAYQQADDLWSVKLDQEWELSHVFPEWKTRKREQWFLRVPNVTEWGSCFTVFTSLFVVQEKNALRRSTYVLFKIFGVFFTQCLGLAYVTHGSLSYAKRCCVLVTHYYSS